MPDGLLLGLSPADVAEMPSEQIPGLLVALSAIQSAIAARLAVAPAPLPNRQREETSDRMLTVAQVAERLGRDKRYVYRRAHSKGWDFTARDGKSLMFSERGLAAWMERRRVDNGFD